MREKKILVLGAFAYVNNSLDGQTVKTRDVYRLVNELLGEAVVDYFDTQDVKKRSKLTIFRMFWKVMHCKMLVYLPAQNNLKFLFPVLFLMSVIFRYRIQYFVVGGWLREFLTHLPVHRYMLKRIEGIHVETKRLKKELEEYYQFKNVDVFPNFRFFEFNPVPTKSDKLRIVFMARVIKQKGLDWMFALAEYIKVNGLKEKYTITFFGPESEEDKSYFEENVRKYNFVEYKGPLQPNEIHETLSQYDVMLLPTHFYTEGLPGSVVDAYISGIPVIVTEWKHSHEFVSDGKSGYIVSFENGLHMMIDRVVQLENDRELLWKLKAYAHRMSMNFSVSEARKLIEGYLI